MWDTPLALLSHLLLSYTSGLMARALEVTLYSEVSFRWKALRKWSGKKEALVLDDMDCALPVWACLSPAFLFVEKSSTLCKPQFM